MKEKSQIRTKICRSGVRSKQLHKTGRRWDSGTVPGRSTVRLSKSQPKMKTVCRANSMEALIESKACSPSWISERRQARAFFQHVTPGTNRGNRELSDTVLLLHSKSVLAYQQNHGVLDCMRQLAHVARERILRKARPGCRRNRRVGCSLYAPVLPSTAVCTRWPAASVSCFSSTPLKSASST